MSSKTLTANANSPPAIDQLPPELDEPYRRLLRVVRASLGMFALVPVESDLPEIDSDRVLERLRRDVDNLGVDLRVADLFYEQWDPLPVIEQAWQGLERPAVVVLRGLERTPPAPLGTGKDPRPSAFARLNQTREHIEQHFPEPLIVWCEPQTFSALQRYAPDFFDHFTGLVRFKSPATAAGSEVMEPRTVYDSGQLVDRRMTINTDDPEVFNTSLAHEYYLLGEILLRRGVPEAEVVEWLEWLRRSCETSPSSNLGARSALRFYEAQIERSVPGSPERVKALVGLAEALADLPGSEQHAAAAQALEALGEALPLISPGRDPVQWARARKIQGRALWSSSKFQEARDSLSESLEVYRRLVRENPDAYETDIAGTLDNLGSVLRTLGEFDTARDAYQEALEIRRRLAEQHPAAFEPDVAGTLNNLGDMLRVSGERDTARGVFGEALEIYRRLAKQHPATFEPDIVKTLINLGTVLAVLGERVAARGALEEALEIYRRRADKHPSAFKPARQLPSPWP